MGNSVVRVAGVDVKIKRRLAEGLWVRTVSSPAVSEYALSLQAVSQRSTLYVNSRLARC